MTEAELSRGAPGRWRIRVERSRPPRLSYEPVAEGSPAAEIRWPVELLDGPRPASSERTGVSGSEDVDRGLWGLFDGVLRNRRELSSELALPAGSSALDLVIAAVRRWGASGLDRLDGTFAVVVSDRSGRLVLAGDRLGTLPIFYARGERAWHASPAVERIVEQPDVSREVSRVFLAERLLHRFHSSTETVYRAVRCRGPLERLTLHDGDLASESVAPQPLPPIDTALTPEEAESRFDDAFAEAVRHALRQGKAGILLSGGLDSVAVADEAARLARREGFEMPCALSFYLPEPPLEEMRLQQRVAERLALEQVLIPPVGGARGLLAAALEVAADWPVPLLNFWYPTHLALAREGGRRGCRVLLTGGGGDEWLATGHGVAAELLTRGDWRALALLRRSLEISYGADRRQSARAVFWSYGLRLLLREGLVRSLDAVGPLGRRIRASYSRSKSPNWIADPTLKQELELRAATRVLRREQLGFHRRDRVGHLQRPLQTLLRQENAVLAARAGVRFLEPFWDAPLTDFLLRLPPKILLGDGRAKVLLRRRLEKSLPGLGLGQQKKYDYEPFAYRLIRDESSAAWQRLGGAKSLSNLEVVVSGNILKWVRQTGAAETLDEAHLLWTLMSVETWLRSHE